jgi:O-antigen/teichoic acid export membrane protein
MFRFAAEPFFFQRAKDKGSKQLYATVMEYFTAFCGFVFLGVILYMDIIGLIIGQDFRAALGVVPVMLLSYMLLGLNFKVSMWYKLAEKTSMAIYITLAGLAVTIVVNLAFMPLYSYWAAAFGHLLSYLVMFIVNAVLGQKYYPIPYRWNRIISFFIFIGVIYGLTYAVDTFFFSSVYVGGGTPGLLALKLATHTVLLGVYLLASWKILKTAKLTTE